MFIQKLSKSSFGAQARRALASLTPSKQTTGLSSRLYEGHIDGLRALAISFVVAFHIWPGLFPFGWAGVDAFFVVSGYLIMHGLIRDISAGRFSFLSFLSRRLRRLFPQLLTMLAASSVAALVIFNSEEIREFAVRQISAVTYVSNIVFSLEGSYFSETKYLNPLLHTWSLGVEEQFYLLAPLALLFIWKISAWNRLPLVLIVGAILSFVVWGYLQTGIVFPTHGANIAFYWLPARAWELLAGGLLAWSIHFSKTKLQKNLALVLVSGQVVISLLAAFFLPTLWPSVVNVVTVLATTLMIQFGNDQKLRFLATGFIREVGLLSYAIYVWHWPIVSFLTTTFGSLQDNLGVAAVALLATALTSLLTYRFIEIRFRYKRRAIPRVRAKTFGLASAFAMITLLLLNAPLLQSAEKQSAEVLQQADAIYFSGLNERLFVQERLDLMRGLDKWDAVALGSSRMMQVDSNLVGRPTLNVSVFGANIQDLVYLSLEGQRATGVKEIFMSIDPWMLNENYRDERWTTFFSKGAPQVEAALMGANRTTSPGRSNQTPDLSIASIIFDSINLSEKFLEASGSQPEVVNKLTQDGRLILSGSAYDNSLDSESIANSWTHGSLDNFNLSKRKVAYTKELIRALGERGVSVKIVLLPYHPAVFGQDGQLEARDTITLIEETISKLAASLNVSVLGSFDPASVGCIESEFLDAIHPLQTCTAKALKRIAPTDLQKTQNGQD